MGTSGGASRKPKRRLAKVAKYEEASDLHLAGLAESSNSVSGTRLGHRKSRTRSEDLGHFGRFVLRCLGRRAPARLDEPGAAKDAG